MSGHLHVTYCDDIRFERGNKKSFMGVYEADMFVSSMPALLPKHCIVAAMDFPVDKRPSELVVSVTLGEQLLVETDNLASDIASRIPESRQEHGEVDGQRRLNFEVHIVLSPFAVEQPSVLRCRAVCDGKTMKAKALRISKQEKTEAANNDGPPLG